MIKDIICNKNYIEIYGGFRCGVWNSTNNQPFVIPHIDTPTAVWKMCFNDSGDTTMVCDGGGVVLQINTVEYCSDDVTLVSKTYSTGRYCYVG